MLMVTLFHPSSKGLKRLKREGSTWCTATSVRGTCLQSAWRSCISPAQWYTFIQPFGDLKQHHACTYEWFTRARNGLFPTAHHQNAGVDESHMSSSYRRRTQEASKQARRTTDQVALISPPQPSKKKSPHRFAKREGFRRSTALTVRPMEAAHRCNAPMQ